MSKHRANVKTNHKRTAYVGVHSPYFGIRFVGGGFIKLPGTSKRMIKAEKHARELLAKEWILGSR